MQKPLQISKIWGYLSYLTFIALFLAACVQQPTPTATVLQTQQITMEETNSLAAESTPSPVLTEVPGGTSPLATETAVESPSAVATEAVGTATPTGVPEGGDVIQPENALQVQAISGIQLPETRLFAWLPDSESVAVATETEIVFYGLNPLQATGRFAAPQATQLEVAPDGKILAWAGEDNVLHIWGIPENQELHTLTERSGGISSLKFSPDSKLLAVSSPEQTVELWDPATAQKVQSWNMAFWVTGLSFSPDGSLLAGVELDSFTVHIFRIPTGQEERSFSLTDTASPALYGAEFTPDWKTIAWWSRGTVQLMDTASEELGPALGHEDFISALTISPAGRLLASAAAGTFGEAFQPLVYFWDMASGELLNQLPQEAPVNTIRFSPDGRTLAVLTTDNLLRFFEVPQ